MSSGTGKGYGIGERRIPTPNEIVYIHEMDRKPTIEDRDNKLGYEGFVRRLQEESWAGSDGDTALRAFDVSFGTYTKFGEHYIWWKAVEKAMHYNSV